ncbi:MAG: hypothetical protein ENTB_04557 [Enterocloster aldenensis]
MIDRNISVPFYAKCWKEESLISSGLSPPLYIDRHLLLPSLCEASHKDGWGEGFEQRPINTGDGELYVSFWNAGSDFSIRPDQELKGEQAQGFGMQMGGM